MFKIIIIIVFLFFIGCDNSFNYTDPFDYSKTSSKIKTRCNNHNDCLSKSCDLLKKVCKGDPCENINCLGNGKCILNDGNPICICNKGFQDNDNNLECKKSCNYKEKREEVQICMNKYIVGCNDSDGTVECLCKEGYEHDKNSLDCNIGYFIIKVDRIKEVKIPIKEVKIPINKEYKNSYNYDIDCDYSGIFNPESKNNKGDYICRYDNKDSEHRIAIRGDFPAIYFNGCNGNDNDGNDDICPKNYENSLKIISIEQWGTQKWKSMKSAFRGCENLKGNAIDIPDLSEVTDMSYMLSETKFNQAINDWNVSNVENMSHLFDNNKIFIQELDKWNVSHVTDMSYMFKGTFFNQSILVWNVSNVVTMEGMFQLSGFNRALNDHIDDNHIIWDVSKVENMSRMFEGSIFNKSIFLNTSEVKDMSYMFSGSTFNMPINFDTSKVVNMEEMFSQNKLFDQVIFFDTSKVVNMSRMFAETYFNQPLDTQLTGVPEFLAWNVSGVKNMYEMFSNATLFNQNLSFWDVSNVTNCINFDYHTINWNEDKPIFENCTK